MKSTSLEAEIQRANGAWTEADVNSSSAGVTMRNENPVEHEIMTPNIALNPCQTEAVVGIDKGIRMFWKKHGARFGVVWRGMTPDARRRLLLTVGPDMAKTRNDSEAYGQLTLIPEFVLNELSSDGAALIQLIDSVVTSELSEQYFQDTQLVRGLIREGKVYPDDSNRGYLAFLHGLSHVGEMLMINRARMAELGAEGVRIANQLNEFERKGIIVEGPVFSRVLDRRSMLVMTLALIMDEMKENVFDAQKPDKKGPVMARGLQCSLPRCTNTKWTDEEGRQRPLKLCSRCRGSAYCSKACQLEDRQEHRVLCGKKKASKSATLHK